jgi:hypothetical protein
MISRIERRAVPKPIRIPSGDRPVYPPDEGPPCLPACELRARGYEEFLAKR